MSLVPAPGPTITHDGVTFYFEDPGETLRQVRLHQEIRRPRNGPDFVRSPGSDLWQATIERAPVGRIEYRIELVRPDGTAEIVCDPSNPLRARGPFGDRSVLELPGYERPAWLGARVPEGSVALLAIPSRALGASVRVELWSSAGTSPGKAAPLLIAHDGPEYARYSSLLEFLDFCVGAGELPPMRAALVAPVDRNQNYSASVTYGRALAHEILPALDPVAPTPHHRPMRVGMGASLGALAMLHAHRSHPAILGALFLQSGSFFRQRLDGHESGFVGFRRISRHVGRVLGSTDWTHPVTVAMTCGTVEENLANNRVVHDALRAQGYDVTLGENRDAHNWVAWRDCFDPMLTRLLQSVWT